MNYFINAAKGFLRNNLQKEKTLECRRHLAAVTTFYKSINNLIYFPIPVSVRPADPRTRS